MFTLGPVEVYPGIEAVQKLAHFHADIGWYRFRGSYTAEGVRGVLKNGGTVRVQAVKSWPAPWPASASGTASRTYDKPRPSA